MSAQYERAQLSALRYTAPPSVDGANWERMTDAILNGTQLRQTDHAADRQILIDRLHDYRREVIRMHRGGQLNTAAMRVLLKSFDERLRALQKDKPSGGTERLEDHDHSTRSIEE